MPANLTVNGPFFCLVLIFSVLFLSAMHLKSIRTRAYGKLCFVLRAKTPDSLQLRSYNNEGKSKWSELVSYLTCPEKPQAPRKPKVVGNVTMKSLTLSWGECN